MKSRRRFLHGVILLLAAAPPVATPFDFDDLTNQYAQPPRSESRSISLDEAVSRARRQTDGKILSAETVRVDGREVHRIKVLTRDGRVTRLQIDAHTGRPPPRRR